MLYEQEAIAALVLQFDTVAGFYSGPELTGCQYSPAKLTGNSPRIFLATVLLLWGHPS